MNPRSRTNPKNPLPRHLRRRRGDTSPDHPGKLFYNYADFRKNFREVWLFPDALERQRLSAKACRDALRGTLDGEASSRLYSARYRAKKKGLKCTLTFEKIKALIRDTGNVCPVFRQQFCRGGGRFCMSLDRFLNLNYTNDSVCFICKSANSAKGQKTNESELRMVKQSKLDHVDRELLIDYVESQGPDSPRN